MAGPADGGQSVTPARIFPVSHTPQKSYTRRRCRRRPQPGVPFGGLAEGIDLAAVPALSRSAVLR